MNKYTYAIVRLYLKSASIEVPDMPGMPRLAVQPDIGVDIQTDVKPAWAGHVECTLTVSLHGKLKDKTMFLTEVAQAGVFKVAARDKAELADFAKHAAAETLFPYARRHLASLAISAGFQPVVLDHIDFAALLGQLTRLAKTTPRTAAQKAQREPLPGAGATPSKEATRPPAQQQAAALHERRDATIANVTPYPQSAGARAEPSSTRSQPETPSARLVSAGSRRWLTLSSVACVIAVVAAWQISRSPSSQSTSARPRTAAAPIQRATDVQRQKLLARGEQIIAASRARIADQVQSAYTLELGTVPAADSIPALETLATKRALLVEGRSDGTLAILYGIFPNALLAEAAQAELPTQFPPALVVRRRVLRLEDVGQQTGSSRDPDAPAR